MRINASGQSQVLNIYSNNQNSAKINMNTVSPVFKNRDVLTISKQGKTESLVQQLLNQNKSGFKISRNDILSYDVEEIQDFIANEYMDFVLSIQKDPN